MPFVVFERVLSAMEKRCLFVKRTNASLKRGILTRMRMIAGVRFMAYGKSFDELDDILQM